MALVFEAPHFHLLGVDETVSCDSVKRASGGRQKTHRHLKGSVGTLVDRAVRKGRRGREEGMMAAVDSPEVYVALVIERGIGTKECGWKRRLG